ncbi:MAG: glycoside hydrolase domain-containing protein, partial [Lentisphaerota bacterium]
EIGPLMDSVLNMQMTVKNHNTRSETVRLGFHIEAGGELMYSTYQSKEIPNGLVELRPGETKVLKLRQQMPGLTAGNVLWFDVRSAGQPAKTLFLTRLINFHLMDSQVILAGSISGKKFSTFREARIDSIAGLRPPRNPDFDLRVDVDPYTKRLSAVVDRGIAGVKDEVKTAVEAQLIVKKVFGGEQTEIHDFKTNMVGDFATFLCYAPNIEPGETCEVTVQLFDENMKIVAEQTEAKPFVNLTAAKTEGKGIKGEQIEWHPWEKEKSGGDRPSLSMASSEDDRKDRRESFQKAPWMENTLGQDDRVWEPFTPIQPKDKGFDTLKHRFTLDASGLPAQIDIRPDPRELPLEQRGANANVSPQTLLAIGRGPQLRAPMRLEAVIGGTRVPAQVVTPAKAVRTWKSEIEYASKLRIGPVEADLQTRYDCDGSLHATLIYGSGTPVKIDRLELVADIAGAVDLAVFDDRREYSLPKKTGVVWDSTAMHLELFYTKFVPWFWFGSDDRGWSYFAHNDKGWILDRDGSAMQLERDRAGDVTWRVAFVNHPAEVKGRHTIEFSLLTHPAKPKPENARLYAWQYNAGEEYQQSVVKFFRGYDPHTAGNYVGIDAPYAPSEKELEEAWYTSASVPTTNIPYAKAAEWRKDKPPYFRYMFKGDLDLPDQNRLLEDKAIFYFERLVRIGRIVGWYTHPFTPAPASQ